MFSDNQEESRMSSFSGADHTSPHSGKPSPSADTTAIIVPIQDEPTDVDDGEEGALSQWDICLALAIGILLRFACRQYIYNDLLRSDAGPGPTLQYDHINTAHYHLIDVVSYRTWQDSSLIECFVRRRWTGLSSRSFCPDFPLDYALEALSYIFERFTTSEIFLASVFVQLCTYRLIFLIYRKTNSLSLNIFWYSLCPILVLSSACSFLQCIFHLAIALFVYTLYNGWLLGSVVIICVLCATDYKFLTLVPIIHILSHQSTVATITVASVGAISCMWFLDADFTEKVTHVRAALQDNFYIPSIGVVWYARAQVFDRYAAYFSSLWHLQPYVLSMPLCIRLKEHPTEAVLLQLSIILFFRNEVSGGDVAFLTALFLAHWSTLVRVRWIAPVAFTIYGPILITPVLLHLWIDIGSGNANYLFFQGFGMSLAVAMFISGFANATLKHRPRNAPTVKKQKVSLAKKLD